MAAPQGDPAEVSGLLSSATMSQESQLTLRRASSSRVVSDEDATRSVSLEPKWNPGYRPRLADRQYWGAPVSVLAKPM